MATADDDTQRKAWYDLKSASSNWLLTRSRIQKAVKKKDEKKKEQATASRLGGGGACRALFSDWIAERWKTKERKIVPCLLFDFYFVFL